MTRGTDATGLVSITAAHTLLYRVGRTPDPFSPPSWAYARPDGTFGGRFDDPSGRRGIGPDERYRAIYLAEHAVAAYCETIATFRLDLPAVARGPRLAQPNVPMTWRTTHRLGSTQLHRTLTFADLTAGESIQTLRRDLAAVAVALGLADIDLSALTGPHRFFTQECAHYIYDQRDDAGHPIYAGLRYVSRFNPSWPCWVAFSDRLRHRVARVQRIESTDPDLREAARMLHLGVES